MGLDFDALEYCKNLKIKQSNPPYACPVSKCDRSYKSLIGLQYHLLNFDHDNPQPLTPLITPNRKKTRARGVHHSTPKGGGIEDDEQVCGTPGMSTSGSVKQTAPTNPETLVTYNDAEGTVQFNMDSKSVRLCVEDPLPFIDDEIYDDLVGRGCILNANAAPIESNAPWAKVKVPEAHFVEIEDYNVPDAPPRSLAYYRFIEKSVEELDAEIEYDVDEEDTAWLEYMNEQREKMGLNGVNIDTMELLMDRLEKESYFQAAANGIATGVEVDDDAVCCICMDGECQNTNVILFCDMCNLAVHQDCYGVPYIPEGQWLCRRCLQSPSTPVNCVLCPNTGGAFKQTDRGQWAHVVCALWIPEVRFANTVFLEPIDSIETIPPARWRLTCYVCKEKGLGACIQCQRNSCYAAFHVTCAQQAGLYMTMDTVKDGHNDSSVHVQKYAYCHAHTPADAKLKTNQKEVEDTRHKMKEARKALAKKRSSAPVVLIPTIPADRIQEIAGMVHMQKKQQFLDRLIAYWTLKRKFRNGVPLLRRLQSQGNHHGVIHRNGIEGSPDTSELYRQLKYWQCLRQDLERARLLCELVRKREKLKAAYVKICEQCVMLEINPLESALTKLLDALEARDTSEIFREPVDTNEVPDYLDIVTHPMDLGTMRKKLTSGEYGRLEQLEADFDLMIQNCLAYNNKDTVFYRAGIRMRDQAAALFVQAREDLEREGLLDRSNCDQRDHVEAEVDGELRELLAMPASEKIVQKLLILADKSQVLKNPSYRTKKIKQIRLEITRMRKTLQKARHDARYSNAHQRRNLSDEDEEQENVEHRPNDDHEDAELYDDASNLHVKGSSALNDMVAEQDDDLSDEDYQPKTKKQHLSKSNAKSKAQHQHQHQQQQQQQKHKEKPQRHHHHHSALNTTTATPTLTTTAKHHKRRQAKSSQSNQSNAHLLNERSADERRVEAMSGDDDDDDDDGAILRNSVAKGTNLNATFSTTARQSASTQSTATPVETPPCSPTKHLNNSSSPVGVNRRTAVLFTRKAQAALKGRHSDNATGSASSKSNSTTPVKEEHHLLANPNSLLTPLGGNANASNLLSSTGGGGGGNGVAGGSTSSLHNTVPANHGLSSRLSVTCGGGIHLSPLSAVSLGLNANTNLNTSANKSPKRNARHKRHPEIRNSTVLSKKSPNASSLMGAGVTGAIATALPSTLSTPREMRYDRIPESFRNYRATNNERDVSDSDDDLSDITGSPCSSCSGFSLSGSGSEYDSSDDDENEDYDAEGGEVEDEDDAEEDEECGNQDADEEEEQEAVEEEEEEEEREEDQGGDDENDDNSEGDRNDNVPKTTTQHKQAEVVKPSTKKAQSRKKANNKNTRKADEELARLSAENNAIIAGNGNATNLSGSDSENHANDETGRKSSMTKRKRRTPTPIERSNSARNNQVKGMKRKGKKQQQSADDNVKTKKSTSLKLTATATATATVSASATANATNEILAAVAPETVSPNLSLQENKAKTSKKATKATQKLKGIAPSHSKARKNNKIATRASTPSINNVSLNINNSSNDNNNTSKHTNATTITTTTTTAMATETATAETPGMTVTANSKKVGSSGGSAHNTSGKQKSKIANSVISAAAATTVTTTSTATKVATNNNGSSTNKTNSPHKTHPDSIDSAKANPARRRSVSAAAMKMRMASTVASMAVAASSPLTINSNDSVTEVNAVTTVELTNDSTTNCSNSNSSTSTNASVTPSTMLKPPLEPLQLVWAKCRGYPWYPALILDPKTPKGFVYNGVPLPAPPADVLALRKNYPEEVLFLVLFFDAKRTWQWLPEGKLEILGIDKDVDQQKLIESRKPTERKAVKKAYQDALHYQSQVSDLEGQGPDPIM